MSNMKTLLASTLLALCAHAGLALADPPHRTYHEAERYRWELERAREQGYREGRREQRLAQEAMEWEAARRYGRGMEWSRARRIAEERRERHYLMELRRERQRAHATGHSHLYRQLADERREREYWR